MPRKGQKHSEESIEKMRKNGGRKFIPDEERKKLSMDRTGKGNPMYGHIYTDEERNKLSESKMGHITTQKTRDKIRDTKKGDRNYNWKGDNVNYKTLHIWVRKYLPKPKLCERCNSKPPRDLANISGKYLRNFKDWWYLCRKCHVTIDDTMKKINNRTKKQRSEAGKKAWITRRNNKK